MSKGEYFISSESLLNNHVLDVFQDTFDTTWMSGFAKIPSKFYYNHSEGIKIDNNDKSVIYSFNSDHFRCDEFTNIHNGKHILFAGCSESEGIGGNIEESWPYMVYSELNKDNSFSGFFNISKAGAGWQKIMSNFMIYVKNYGVPDCLFILMPNIGRTYEWEEESNIWSYHQRFPWSAGDHEETKYNRHMTIEEHRKFFINFVITWKLFQSYCDLLGTKLLWSTWDYTENNNYIVSNQFPTFFNMEQQEMEKYIANNCDRKVPLEKQMHKRDGHSGKIINEYWKECFLNEIKTREMLND